MSTDQEVMEMEPKPTPTATTTGGSVTEMVKEMAEAGSARQVSEASGVNYISVGNIRNEKQLKISKTMSDKLDQTYQDWKAGKISFSPSSRGRKPGSTGTRKPRVAKERTGELTLDQMIKLKEKELADVEKIKQELDILKKKKGLQEKHDAEMQALVAKHKQEMDALS
ncbi:MAG: hypothetical protein WAV84_15465 [Bacteroidota bacterium]